MASAVIEEQDIIFWYSAMSMKAVWDYAKKYNRPTLYDSFYMSVAEETESELWTADSRLVNSLNGEIPWVKSVMDGFP